MRRILLMILMTVAGNSAAAEWVKVGNNETDVFYADPATIIKSSSKVKMQTLHDFRIAVRAAGNVLLSTVMQEEYDCIANRSRVLFYSLYTKNMGKGREIHKDTEPHDWEPVRPGSVREALFRFACNRKQGT